MNLSSSIFSDPGAMAGFLSNEIPRPLRRRLSRTTLHGDDDDEPLLQQLSRQEELRQEKQRQMEDYVKEKLNETANKNAGILIRDVACLN